MIELNINRKNTKAVRRSLDVGGLFLMFYVYILKSLTFDQIYIGYTDNLQERLANHNRGSTSHTAKFKPWEMKVCIGFKTEAQALKFEKYLKTCSGRAFVAKRLLES